MTFTIVAQNVANTDRIALVMMIDSSCKWLASRSGTKKKAGVNPTKIAVNEKMNAQSGKPIALLSEYL